MKQLKSFIPFRCDATLYNWLGIAAKMDNTLAFNTKTEHLHATDPTGASWGTLGMIAPLGGGIVHDLDGAARMLVYQFNDRNLPAAVRNEALAKEVAALEGKQGHAVTKKQYAEMRDDIEMRLLPKAFVKRTLVPVLVYKDAVFVCTTSVKKCESVLAEMMKLATIKPTVTFEPAYVLYKESPHFVFKNLAVDGHALIGDNGNCLDGNASLKLRGSDKRVISIKDRDLDADEVQNLLKDDAYAVTELAMSFSESDQADPSIMFTMNDKGVFKGIKLGALVTAGLEAGDRHATCWITAKSFGSLFGAVLELHGGEAEQGDPEDDDEL